MIEEPVMGKWEPLLSQSDFKKVQQILEGNPSGYQHKKEEDARPLTRLLKCDSCKGYMVGYEVKKKRLNYYRCGKCRGVCLNAHTTPKALKKGANDLFLDLLDSLTIPSSIIPLVTLQLTKLYDYFTQDQTDDDNLKSQLSTLEKQLKNLKIRHGLGEVDRETYELTSDHLREQIARISKELEKEDFKISNLDSLLKNSLTKLSNIRLVWVSNDLENKRKLQRTLFPDGIYYDAKQHIYLTPKINEFIRFSAYLAQGLNEHKKNSLLEFQAGYDSVPRTGVEPVRALRLTGF